MDEWRILSENRVKFNILCYNGSRFVFSFLLSFNECNVNEFFCNDFLNLTSICGVYEL